MTAAAVLLVLALPALEIAGPAPLLAGGLAGSILVTRTARVLSGGALAAAAMGVHNLPEGLAVAADTLAAGTAPPAAVGLAILSALGEPAGALSGVAAAAWSTAALPWAFGIAADAMARTVLEIWPRPTSRDVAIAGIGGAAGYAGIWGLFAA